MIKCTNLSHMICINVSYIYFYTVDSLSRKNFYCKYKILTFVGGGIMKKIPLKDDFFEKNFNFSSFPSDLIMEEWLPKRELLSKFFTKLHTYYLNYLKDKDVNKTFFVMGRPFNLFFAVNEDVLYFAVNNRAALLGRTSVYKLNDGLKLSDEIVSRYLDISGLVDPLYPDRYTTFVESIDINIVNKENSDSDSRIKELAYKLVEFEISRLEERDKIMNVKPFFGEIDYKINDKKIFMLMPFGDENINQFYIDSIKNPLSSKGYNCLRADDIFNNESIMGDIWRNINEASIIIADLTHRNPNVFYEIGIAHTLGKKVILISQEQGDIPFDLKHVRTIFYKNTPRGASEFTNNLFNTISFLIDESDNKNIQY